MGVGEPEQHPRSLQDMLYSFYQDGWYEAAMLYLESLVVSLVNLRSSMTLIADGFPSLRIMRMRSTAMGHDTPVVAGEAMIGWQLRVAACFRLKRRGV